MLTQVSHLEGISSKKEVTRGEEFEEVLFNTPFGYLFDYLSKNEHCLLPAEQKTVESLEQLGLIMAEPVKGGQAPAQFDSQIPAIFTYLGQFIDHDITARTDRELNFSSIADENGNTKNGLVPKHPLEVVKRLRNGRRPQLDLDSVFGDGPALNSYKKRFAKYKKEVSELYEDDLCLKINDRKYGYVDLPRKKDGRALIADARNDENLMISQLHAAFIKFYNKTLGGLGLRPNEGYSRARQLLRWVYQYIVIHDYLPQVCNPFIVHDTLLNGPFYFIPSGNVFMPLEFSVAGFRFGHSMIRPSYRINGRFSFGDEKAIQDLLGVNSKLLKNGELDKDFVVEWSNFAEFNVRDRIIPQFARLIDTRLSRGLANLETLGGDIRPNTILARLAQRNLLRGFLLSIPTGQSIAEVMRIHPLDEGELVRGLDTKEQQLINDAGLNRKTPLWFYVLQEAMVQQKGQRLGAVGSKIVAETLIGLVKFDPNSYLNHFHDEAVEKDGIIVLGYKIQTIADLLGFAEVDI